MSSKIPGTAVLLSDLEEGNEIFHDEFRNKHGVVGSFENCRPGEVLVHWNDGSNTFISYDMKGDIIFMSSKKTPNPKDNPYYENPALKHALDEAMKRENRLRGEQTLKEKIQRKIDEIKNEIKLTDFRYSVFISMQDGSNFLWRDSFALNYQINNQEFILVFTEHYGYHFFNREDIHSFSQYEKTNVAPIKCAQ